MQYRSDWQRFYDLEEFIYGLIASQHDKCAVCQIEFDFREAKDLPIGYINSSQPRVDHCHITGEIRGVLCIPCNAYIASIERNNPFKKVSEEIKFSAIKYLEKHLQVLYL